jgi:transcriptional regulator with XRE-family HTH domain
LACAAVRIPGIVQNRSSLFNKEMSVSPLGVCKFRIIHPNEWNRFAFTAGRERLGLSQKIFGEIGGVEANAQGKYESGGRAPKADYLSRVAERGVDVLYVLTGTPTPMQMDNLSHLEEKVLGNYRAMFKEDQDAIRRLTTTLAEHSLTLNGKAKPPLEDS